MMPSKEDTPLHCYMTIEEIHEMNEAEYQRLKNLYGDKLPDRPIIKPATTAEEIRKEMKKIVEYSKHLIHIYQLDQERNAANFEPLP